MEKNIKERLLEDKSVLQSQLELLKEEQTKIETMMHKQMEEFKIALIKKEEQFIKVHRPIIHVYMTLCAMCTNFSSSLINQFNKLLTCK